MKQGDLFGVPQCDPALSQWMTPPWLARRIAAWIPRHMAVLEPSFGTGNLIAALLEQGHPAHLIFGVERDPRMWAYGRERFGDCGVQLICANYLEEPTPTCDAVLMNPPFEENQHMRFVIEALKSAEMVCGIFPESIQFSDERDRLLWSQRGRIVGRAIMPERVVYGGTGSPQFDTVGLQIIPRVVPRVENEENLVSEVVWRRKETA